METQSKNSTEEVCVYPQKEGVEVLAELDEMEVLVRHMMSDEYRKTTENVFVTPILSQLLLQKIHKACDILTGES